MNRPFVCSDHFSDVLVGMVAFQGAFHAHAQILENLGVRTRLIRIPDDFGDCTHLILPGGESTTFLKLLEFNDLGGEIRKHAKSGKPLMGTCAGLILIAKNVVPSQYSLGLVDATIERNAYGRQVDSFEADLNIPAIGPEPFHGVFIRAPIIESVEKSVQVLASFGEKPILIRQDNLLGITFHPELSGDTRLHELFLSM